MKLTTFAFTDIGMKRKINQDSFLKDDSIGLFVVADGMGGHRGGEVASRLAVEVLQQYCQQNPHLPGREVLDKGINLSCLAIYKKSLDHEELAGMGTTVVAMLVRSDVLYVGQVGDSRAYLIHKNSIWQITEDHSLLNEELRAGRLAAGQVASYQFKNVITRSVGYENHVLVDIYRRKVQSGDIFLSCTDGLSGLVEDSEILEEITKNGPDLGLENLVKLANKRGGDDNITALAIAVE
jgi:serine/threonine protein phosphatase PrpC